MLNCVRGHHVCACSTPTSTPTHKHTHPRNSATTAHNAHATPCNAYATPCNPVYLQGFEMLLDTDELLALPVLGDKVRQSAASAPVGRPGEVFVSPVSLPKLPGRYYFLFGEPIPTGGVDAADREACAALYTKVRR